MLTRVLATLAPLKNPQVLDAGAGTGALSRRLASILPDLHPVLVDTSPSMLAQAADLDAPRAVASVTALPFPKGTFDAVICAWVIETVDEPHAAVRELLRVLRPGGTLVYSFCSRPARRRDRWRSGPLRAIVHGLFAGHFLNDHQTPYHQCDASTRTSFAGGAVTVISLGTCCAATQA
jgi:ubiquinone/menaquinone biosynthesis C-methylase UbiE